MRTQNSEKSFVIFLFFLLNGNYRPFLGLGEVTIPE